MRDACRSLLVAGAALWALGALVALRFGGTATALAWGAAAFVCIAIGWGAFMVIAGQIANDPKRFTQAMAILPVLRMAAAGLLGWFVVGLLPVDAQGSFWICLVAAYLATLTVETGLLARLVRRIAALKTAEVQGAV